MNDIALKKILISVDFSTSSEVAAIKGISLAEVCQGSVYFLHIGKDAYTSARRLSAFIHRFENARNIPVKKFVAQGAPAKTIVSVARKMRADVIVLGFQESSGIKHLVQGNVIGKVLREADVPVLVVKRQKPSSFSEYVLPQIRHSDDIFQVDKILVPLDFSPASRQAFRYALSLASYYNSTIYTLTVFDKKLKEYGDDHQKHTSVIVRGEKIKLWREFPRLLQGAKHRVSENRIKRLLLPGDPFAKIDSLVEKKEIDLIVMGTNGRSGLEHFFLGSVAEKVIRSVNCSVMTIRANNSEEASEK